MERWFHPTDEYWWLSFADGSKPEGQQFLGAAIVGPAPGFLSAISLAHRININPGGEVRGFKMPLDALAAIKKDDVNKLMNREETEALDNRMKTCLEAGQEPSPTSSGETERKSN